MSNKLYYEHHGSENPYRTKKVLDIFNSMIFDPDRVGQDKGAYGHGECGIDISGRRKKAGDEPYKVTDKDI
jgi:hypothetical protein